LFAANDFPEKMKAGHLLLNQFWAQGATQIKILEDGQPAPLTILEWLKSNTQF